MPIEYRVDPDRRLVVAEGHGTVSFEEITQYQRDLWARSDLAGYDELMDMTDVQAALQPTPARMKELAELAATMDSAHGRSRFAIVAPQHEFFGLGRMYEAYRGMASRSTRQVAVFRDRAQAMLWLAGGGPALDAGLHGPGSHPPA
jgi:hypothetical protein